MAERLDVQKTYKLFIGGAFPRSESGRTFAVSNPDGSLVANVSKGSRKDLRDAVRAAVDTANAADPDLIVLTCDYVTYSRRHIDQLADQLAGLRAPRLLVVLADHDHYLGCPHTAAVLAGHGRDVLGTPRPPPA